MCFFFAFFVAQVFVSHGSAGNLHRVILLSNKSAFYQGLLYSGINVFITSLYLLTQLPVGSRAIYFDPGVFSGVFQWLKPESRSLT